MGSGSSKEVHHYHETFVPDPAVVAELEAVNKQVAELDAEAQRRGDPNHFSDNVGDLFDNFIRKMTTVSLTEYIDKKPGETHVGLIGPVSVGKSSLCNVMYGTEEKTAAGHCTKDCTPVYTTDKLVVWDMFGADNDFKYYTPETLSFVKDLDYCVVLFDNDIAMVSWIIKTIHTINPNSMIIVRTKIDSLTDEDERTADEEKALDAEKVKDLLELDEAPTTYCISSRNIKKNEGERYDWDALSAKINPQ